jgi:hypothetical protein
MKIKHIYAYIISGMMNKILLTLSIILISTIRVEGQNVSYSPYSVFGIGDIDNNDYGKSQGMGGVGIGLKSSESLNRINPASYSGIDSLTFTLEASVSGRSSDFYDGSNRQINSLAGLKKLALGFRVFPFWYTSTGIIPFSNMGYNITSEKTIEGEPSSGYQLNLTGSGSLNRFYFGNAFRITPRLSVGINASFLFGTLTQDENIATNLSTYHNQVETKTYLHRIYLDYGFQYTGEFKNGWKYVAGGILGFKNNLLLNKEVSFINTNSETTISEGSYNSTFTLPFFSGVGFSVKNNSGFTFAMDYVFQNWSTLKNTSKAYSYVDANKYSFGIEYSPAVRLKQNYFQYMFYQAGIFYNQSYLQLRGSRIHQTGYTLGAGFPFNKTGSFLGVSFETGIKGKIGQDLFREKYYQINFNLVLRDIWFLKSKFD